MVQKFLECLWIGEQEASVSGDCFVVWQQGMHEEMGLTMREIEAGWAMASTDSDIRMSGARASRGALR